MSLRIASLAGVDGSSDGEDEIKILIGTHNPGERGEGIDHLIVPETVHRFTQLWRRGEQAEFEIECSSGTYVRSLIADLGDAYCESLRRTRIGPFDVTAAGEALVPLDVALARLEDDPHVRVPGS